MSAQVPGRLCGTEDHTNVGVTVTTRRHQVSANTAVMGDDGPASTLRQLQRACGPRGPPTRAPVRPVVQHQLIANTVASRPPWCVDAAVAAIVRLVEEHPRPQPIPWCTAGRFQRCRRHCGRRRGGNFGTRTRSDGHARHIAVTPQRSRRLCVKQELARGGGGASSPDHQLILHRAGRSGRCDLDEPVCRQSQWSPARCRAHRQSVPLEHGSDHRPRKSLPYGALPNGVPLAEHRTGDPCFIVWNVPRDG
jgi:hypothetical protein